MTRLLINIGIKNVDINVRRTPNYLVDMINKLLNNEPNKIYYTNPFDKKIKSTSVECKLKINNILFHYSKYFGKLKVKKKGRIKRKIKKRVVLINKILD